MKKVEPLCTLLYIVSLIFICLFYGQNISAQGSAPTVLKWNPEQDFVKYTSNKFMHFKDVNLFAYDKTVSVVAVPTAASPVKNIKELEVGKIIGSAYFSTGSIRLNLPPGAYTIFVLKEKGDWKARFLNASGSVISTVPAIVSEASQVDIPLVSLDQSFCYRFDETRVCI